MDWKALGAVIAMLTGFGFAYTQRNSHEDIGLYGIILGILGAVAFAYCARTLSPDAPEADEERQ